MTLVQFVRAGEDQRVGVVQADRALDLTAAEARVRSDLELVV